MWRPPSRQRRRCARSGSPPCWPNTLENQPGRRPDRLRDLGQHQLRIAHERLGPLDPQVQQTTSSPRGMDADASALTRISGAGLDVAGTPGGSRMSPTTRSVPGDASSSARWTTRAATRPPPRPVQSSFAEITLEPPQVTPRALLRRAFGGLPRGWRCSRAPPSGRRPRGDALDRRRWPGRPLPSRQPARRGRR